jgi:HEAT repeat protein
VLGMRTDSEVLIVRLRSGDPVVRRDAARELGERGERAAVPALVEVLRRAPPRGAAESHPEHASRAAAAVALGRIGDPSAAAALLEAIADPFNLGNAASTALGRLSPPPVAELVSATSDPDPWRRARAVMALGEIGDASAFGTMAALLQDPDEAVQRAAASAFEKMRDPRAVTPLMRRLAREGASACSSNLRRAAARALCRIGDPRAAEALARLADHDPDQTVRQVVSRYLRPREGQRGH